MLQCYDAAGSESLNRRFLKSRLNLPKWIPYMGSRRVPPTASA
jgi:hypothetical protein